MRRFETNRFLNLFRKYRILVFEGVSYKVRMFQNGVTKISTTGLI